MRVRHDHAMPEEPSFVRFRAPRETDVYQVALDFTAAVFQVIQLAELERFHLKDQLDRRSTAIALLVSQARAQPGGRTRRGLYQQARRAAMECRAVLDILAQRHTVEASVLEAARDLAADLEPRLATLAAT